MRLGIKCTPMPDLSTHPLGLDVHVTVSGAYVALVTGRYTTEAGVSPQQEGGGKSRGRVDVGEWVEWKCVEVFRNVKVHEEVGDEVDEPRVRHVRLGASQGGDKGTRHRGDVTDMCNLAQDKGTRCGCQGARSK